jgi:hypothetical protein
VCVTVGFLPPDVIELSKRNVDVNPEYSDSLEDATFTVHLMFDAVSEAVMQRAKAEKTQFVDAYQLRGHAAFEAGLDEVCVCVCVCVSRLAHSTLFLYMLVLCCVVVCMY